MARTVLLTILKIVPLIIILRSGLCKLDIPVLLCDGALCPKAIGQEADCTPTGNSAECKAWCQNAWVPHYQQVFSKWGLNWPLPCSEKDGFVLLKAIGAIEFGSYILLWLRPRLGAFLIFATMIGAIEMHVFGLGDSLSHLWIQYAILAAAALILVLHQDSAPAASTASRQQPQKKRGSKKD
eukprot:c27261_g1_i1.p1 GENE.c27261_g1_i1~~c27261_g1_i1.p1  ORF type:complete len:199 (+),score=41.19 c27261_g1_i1:52-597(+)